MKNRIAALLLLLALAGGLPLKAYAEEQKDLRPAHQIEILDSAAMEKMKPGATMEQNSVLAPMAGAWNIELTYFSSKDADPQVSTGTAQGEMLFDKRYLSTRFKALLNAGGQIIPYEGWSLVGYDAAKKAYTSVLADTLHNGLVQGSAQYDEKAKTLEEKGTFTNPLPGKEGKYRSVTELGGEEFKRTVFIADKSGKEFKVLEITFRRRL